MVGILLHYHNDGVVAGNSSQNVRRFATVNHYIYVSAEHIASRSEMGTSNLGDAILDVKFSGNMGVIITKSGYANAIGVVVDGRKSSDILGTVAGDNTIIMVMKENADHANVLEMLHKTFPSLQSL